MPERTDDVMSTQAKETLERAQAAIVVEDGENVSIYPMYEVRDIIPTGALLTGSLLLEVGEELLLELSLGETERVRVKAAVLSVEKRETPGVFVSFSELGEREKNLIQAWVAQASQS